MPVAPSAAKARVLSQVARYRALAGNNERAIQAGQEALAIAEQLGLDELRGERARATSHSPKATPETSSGARADLERSIEIALAVNSPDAARGYNNLAAMTSRAGDVRRALELRQESVILAERFGINRYPRYSRSNVVWHLYQLGRWDETMQLADELIAEGE